MSGDSENLPDNDPSIIGGNFVLDEAVIEAMPKGTKVLTADSYGYSAWTVTARIATLQPDGSSKIYFLKCAEDEHGGSMMRGEHTAVIEAQKVAEGLFPAPRALGKFKVSGKSTYFYLSDFVDMDVSTAPDPGLFCARLAELHRGTSANQMFGFHVPTCDGKVSYKNEWEDSWTTYFNKVLLNVAAQDVKTNGPWPELEAATQHVVTHVTPRLLDNLKWDGHPIKPSLIHGDMWEGNVGTNLETGDIVLFDGSCYYAHNEMELGMWRAKWNNFRRRPYIREYVRNFPVAEPIEEFDDRNRLYSLKYNLNYATGHPGAITRETAYNNMCYLSEKYAPMDGMAKYDPSKDPSGRGLEIG